MRKRSALIVGGGIGGLSTAIALSNNGFKVKVVELKADLHSSVFGVGIIQPVNALRALDMIDCLQPCLDAGYSTTAWAKLLNADGQLLKEIPGATIEGSDLPPMNGVTRPVLHKVLTDKALAVGATIEYNKSIKNITESVVGAEVAFSDGKHQVFDIVVGADGAYSMMRDYVYPTEVQTLYTGQSAFRLNIPRKMAGEMEIDRIILQAGPSGKGKAGFVPIGPELAYFFYNTAWERNLRPAQSELPEVLRKCLEGFGGLTATVRDQYINDPEAIVFRPFDGLIAPRPWHKGRVVLLGDAVHSVTPHFGQGAAIAQEDGIVLAECLAAHKPSSNKINPRQGIEDAFTAYAERRYERCKLIVDSGMQIGQWEMNPVPGMAEAQAKLTQGIIETMVKPL